MRDPGTPYHTYLGRPFFARFDPRAHWFDDLEPAFGDREFFFEQELRAITRMVVPRMG